MLKPDEKCPLCGGLHTVEVITRTKEFRNKRGEPFQVEDHVSFQCSACGEDYISYGASRLNDPKILDAKRISEGLLPSTEIKRIFSKVKKTCHLPESQIEQILGISDRSIPRWKNHISQSPIVDVVLFFLDRDPEAIRYIAERRGVPMTETAKPKAKRAPSKRKTPPGSQERIAL